MGEDEARVGDAVVADEDDIGRVGGAMAVDVCHLRANVQGEDVVPEGAVGVEERRGGEIGGRGGEGGERGERGERAV